MDVIWLNPGCLLLEIIARIELEFSNDRYLDHVSHVSSLLHAFNAMKGHVVFVKTDRTIRNFRFALINR